MGTTVKSISFFPFEVERKPPGRSVGDASRPGPHRENELVLAKGDDKGCLNRGHRRAWVSHHRFLKYIGYISSLQQYKKRVQSKGRPTQYTRRKELNGDLFRTVPRQHARNSSATFPPMFTPKGSK